MYRYSNVNGYKIIKRNILSAVPIIFILSPLVHFLYALLGKNIVLAAFLPINESIWEHLKLGTIPIILWWSISYLVLKKKIIIDLNKWILCTGVSVVLIQIVITNFYYFYTGAFGIESLVLDIFSLLLALIVAQFMALHLYKNLTNSKGLLYMGAVLIIIVILSTIIFSYYPCKIPIFQAAP